MHVPSTFSMINALEIHGDTSASTTKNRSAPTLPRHEVHLLLCLFSTLLIKSVLRHSFRLITQMTLKTAVARPQPAWISVSVDRRHFGTTRTHDVPGETLPSRLSIRIGRPGCVHARHLSVLIRSRRWRWIWGGELYLTKAPVAF